MRTTDGDPEPLPEAPPPEVRRAQEERLLAAWRRPTGWRKLSAVNNTDVGYWYTSLSFVFFLFAGLLALAMRAQLAFPGNDLLTADRYNQFFTMHGSIMMFLFAVPLFEAFSIMVLPEIQGSRELPFPKLSAFGFWCFAIGGVFVSGSLFFGAGAQGGWFMYPPLSTAFQPGIGNDIWLLGLSFIEVASIAAAVELIVGVLRCRPPGMRINLVPLYSWYVLVVGAMILFAFPPLIAGDVLLELERLLDWPFFDPERGGDPILWQHLFWIFGHPEVYIVFLPSIALVAMMVPTYAQTPVVGYTWIVLAAVGTGFLSFGLWVHHMFTVGLPGISLALFSAASEAVAIPTGVQIFCFIATALAGRVVFRPPMLFILGGFATFVLGGLTGVMVALVPFDFQAHDSHFVVAHLHSVLIGGVLFPVVAAFYYFFPLVDGKALSERLGHVVFWLMFVGFNLTFVPMHLTGLLGMPRRVYTYEAGLGFDALNLLSTLGAYVLAAGVALFVFDVVRPKPASQCTSRNPWNAGTLEWLAQMPSKPWGVRSIPEIDGRYPLWDQPDFVRHVDEGRFYLPDAQELRRETIVTSPVDARPRYVLRVPHESFLPLLTALGTGGCFIFTTFHWWWAAAASSALALAFLLAWLWTGTALIPEKPAKDAGLGLTLPLYASGPESVGWWGMLVAMLGDMTAFLALVFGYFFYWTVHEDFPPPELPDPHVGLTALGLGLVLLSWGLTLAARRWNRRDRPLAFTLALAIAAVAAVLGGWALLRATWGEGMDPVAHVYPAIVHVIVAWTVLHVGVGVIMQGYCAARRLAGHMTARYDADIWNVALYWHFVALTALVTALVVAGFPLVAG